MSAACFYFKVWTVSSVKLLSFNWALVIKTELPPSALPFLAGLPRLLGTAPSQVRSVLFYLLFFYFFTPAVLLSPPPPLFIPRHRHLAERRRFLPLHSRRSLAPSLFTLASLCLSRTTGCPGSVFALSRLSDAQIPHHRPPGDSASPLLSSAVSFFLLSSTDYPARLKTKGCSVVLLTHSLQFGFENCTFAQVSRPDEW